MGLIGYWPTGSPGSYSLSHTGDAYLSLRSLNGEGLNITSSLQPQVCTEGSCRVGLNAVNPATQIPWIPTFSLAVFFTLLCPQIPSWLYLWPNQILTQNKLTLLYTVQKILSWELSPSLNLWSVVLSGPAPPTLQIASSLFLRSPFPCPSKHPSMSYLHVFSPSCV